MNVGELFEDELAADNTLLGILQRAENNKLVLDGDYGYETFTALWSEAERISDDYPASTVYDLYKDLGGSGVIYGAGGYNRYGVKQDGSIAPIRTSFSNKTVLDSVANELREYYLQNTAVNEDEEELEEYISVDQAKRINVPVKIPSSALFQGAVNNSPAVRITDDGILVDVVRFQKPQQAGADSVRSSVYYMPTGVRYQKEFERGAKRAPNEVWYGGASKISGVTLLKAPLFVKGALGGMVPERAYDAIKGKGAYGKLMAEIRSIPFVLTSASAESHSRRRSKFANLLRAYGGDADKIDYIYDKSQNGNQLTYAIIENIVAHAVRDAGYDSVMGYSVGKSGPFITEIIDVRALDYPTEFGASAKIHPMFSLTEEDEIDEATLYHGTPHEVDRFCLTKIGTGEGNATFGWGLYFAEHKGVATSYRDQLGPRKFYYRGREYFPDVINNVIQSMDEAPCIPLNYVTDNERKVTKRHIIKALSDITKLIAWRKNITYTAPPAYVEKFKKEDASIIAKYEELYDVIKKLNPKDYVIKQGNLYTITIQDDVLKSFLDWDKKLSEQPLVMSILRDDGSLNLNDADKLTGDLFYNELSRGMGGKEKASEWLSSIGIKGVKFLDAMSRNRGYGTRNVVVFDDSIVKITHKNDKELVSESVDITQTPQFKAWFNGSKVVDAHGKPLVMYHGTAATTITRFQGWRGAAGHFAFDPATANAWADTRYADAQDNGTDEEYGDGAVVYPVYMRAKNIFDPRVSSHVERLNSILNKKNRKVGKLKDYDDIENYSDAIKMAGFDSYYDFEHDIAEPPQGIAVFNANQIKSAIGNKGTFDPSKDDICESADITQTPQFIKAWLGNGKMLFHVTPTKNLKSIMRRGLVPTIGDRSASANEEDAANYVFDSTDALDDALTNWLGELFDENEKLSLLAIRNTNGKPTRGAEYELTVNTVIPSDNLLVVSTDIDSDVNVIERLKSAIGNKGTFAPMKDNITETDDAPVLKLSGTKTAGKVADFLSAFKAKYPANPFNPNERVMLYDNNESMVAFDLSRSNVSADLVHIGFVHSYPQKSGVGSRGMKDLQTMATEFGVGLELSPWDKGQVPKSVLTRFYKALGFKPKMKGSDIMVWKPTIVTEGIEGNVADITQTPQFKNWFGGSKIVDKNGNPLKVYRGESQGGDFRKFSYRETNENAFFFTADYDIARDYARGKEPRAFYLRVHKLFNPNTTEGERFIREWATSFEDDGWIDRRSGEEVDPYDCVMSGELFDYEGTWSSRRWRDLQASINAAGYDGAILPDMHSRSYMESIIVFDPKNIKRAEQNTGYSLDSDDIYEGEMMNTTDNGNFNNWFGKSQVVDSNGKPLVVYHGTGQDFAAFKEKDLAVKGSHYLDIGVHFSSGHDVANLYANLTGIKQDFPNYGTSMSSGMKAGSPVVYPCFLRIENMLDLTKPLTPEFKKKCLEYTDKFFKTRRRKSVILIDHYPIDILQEIQRMAGKARLSRFIRSSGYDGIKYSFEGDCYVVFDPKQIKSAVGNKGSYSTEKADITENTLNTPMKTQRKQTMEDASGGACSSSAIATVSRPLEEDIKSLRDCVKPFVVDIRNGDEVKKHIAGWEIYDASGKFQKRFTGSSAKRDAVKYFYDNRDKLVEGRIDVSNNVATMDNFSVDIVTDTWNPLKTIVKAVVYGPGNKQKGGRVIYTGPKANISKEEMIKRAADVLENFLEDYKGM